MALYTIDTTIFSLLVREHPKVLSRLESLSAEDRVVLCTVVRGEILYGLARLPDGKRKQALMQKVDGVFASIPCEAVAPGAASHYAQIKHEAEEKGTPLDETTCGSLRLPWTRARPSQPPTATSSVSKGFRSKTGAPEPDGWMENPRRPRRAHHRTLNGHET